MDEYIKRDGVLSKFNIDDRMNLNGTSISLQDARETISNFPAADVAPVRHGRWEDGDPICPVCGEDKFKDLDADIWSDWKPPFCPNCGAKMNGERKENSERSVKQTTLIA